MIDDRTITRGCFQTLGTNFGQFIQHFSWFVQSGVFTHLFFSACAPSLDIKAHRIPTKKHEENWGQRKGIDLRGLAFWHWNYPWSKCLLPGSYLDDQPINQLIAVGAHSGVCIPGYEPLIKLQLDLLLSHDPSWPSGALVSGESWRRTS